MLLAVLLEDIKNTVKEYFEWKTIRVALPIAVIIAIVLVYLGV